MLPYLTCIPACMVLLGLQQGCQVADAPSCHDVGLHDIAEAHQPASAGSGGLRRSSAVATEGGDEEQGNVHQGGCPSDSYCGQGTLCLAVNSSSWTP